jgi:DNA-directed RNA polymerase specialized sigma24 family protein
MAYDKEVIDQLFAQYIGSRESADLEALIMECEPMVVVVLARYDELQPFHEDIIQEVLLRLWQAFGNVERMCQESQCPHVWIYKKVRDYIITTTRQYARQHGLSLRLTEREKEIIDMRDSEQRSFDDIAAILKVQPETVKCYYSIAHSKLESATHMANGHKSLLEQASSSSLDPAKRYEMKDLHRVWREKLHAMAEAHPNLCSSASTRKAFERYADDLLGKEMTTDE